MYNVHILNLEIDILNLKIDISIWKLLFESKNCYLNIKFFNSILKNIYLNMTVIFEFWKKLFESKTWYFDFEIGIWAREFVLWN
jgi:hypothetical protein